MRQADVNDAWRDAPKDRKLQIRRISAAGVPPLDTINEELPSGLVVICGLNGVGKTSLLRLVEATLNGRVNMEGRCRVDLLTTGDFSLDVITDAGSNRIVLSDAGSSLPALSLDAFDLCARALRLASEPNYTDVFDGVESHIFSPEELDDANYVVGASYQKIEIFEVEEPGSEGRILVLPTVTRDGHTYAFNEMGTGELAALSLLWLIRSAESNTILLLEEPESFLSSNGRVALMDILARQIHRSRLYAIVTTHSTDIAARVPVGHTRVLLRPPGRSTATLRSPANRVELEKLLGVYGGQARLIFVEDKIAGVFVSELLNRLGGVWGSTVQVREMGGVDGVLRICSLLPKVASIAACGVIDGDQRNRLTNWPRDLWPVTCLPGDCDPASLLRPAASNHVGLFADRLGRSVESVTGALNSCAGADDHDWFRAVAGVVGRSEENVLVAGIECWLQETESLGQAKSIVEAVSAALLRE